MSNKFFNLLGGFLLLLAAGNLSATQVDRVTLDEAIRDAGLIFQGTVTKIESHTLAELGANYEPTRFAFVTFRVEHILKGQIDGNNKSFTLPFHSCLILDYQKQKSMMEQYPTLSPTDALIKLQPTTTEQLGVGMACEITGMPHFVVGENDILFVDKNAGSSPLVGHYPIVNNKIYPVAWLTKQGEIDFTAPYGIEDEQEAEKRGEILPEEAKRHNWTPPKSGKRIGPDDFAEVIERKVSNLEQSQFMSGFSLSEPMKSANFTDLVYLKIAQYLYDDKQKREAWALKQHQKQFNKGK